MPTSFSFSSPTTALASVSLTLRSQPPFPACTHNMSAEDYGEWSKLNVEQRRDILECFSMDGQLVLGEVQDSVSVCSLGGGGAVVNASTHKIVDIPIYLCAVLPRGSISNVTAALAKHQSDKPGSYRMLDTRGSSSALTTALLPSHMGAWWWLPLLGSVAVAVVC